MDAKLARILAIPSEELGRGSRVALRVLESMKDVAYDIAIHILREVQENNRLGKPTVFIWPVGPVDQYPIMARYANEFGISFKNVHVFQMDEYLTPDLRFIDESDPLSFTGCMKRTFIERTEERYRLPSAQHHVPTPGKEHEILEKILALGGVDTAYGGVGITGHIAFNEPPEPGEPITDEQFCSLTTRVIKVHEHTLITNAHTATRGAYELIPHDAITIGMKEILGARKIRFYMNRDWQSGVVRQLLHGEVTRFMPASFFQNHPDARLTITQNVAEAPIGKLR